MIPAGTTYGIRYYNGWFVVHIMWMDVFPPRQWRSSRFMISRRYKTVETALMTLEKADAVMIFPV